MHWLSTLRDRAYSVQSAQGTRRKTALTSTVPNPPSFYEDDMNKWENKFKKQVQERAEFKKKKLNDEEIGLSIQP